MNRIAALVIGFILLSGINAIAQQTDNKEFADAKWIAMDTDSTIIFPHLHLLKAKSEKGRSLKKYELPMLTKSFILNNSEVKQAKAYICGMGQYELFVNGKKAGDYFLSPGWTMYNKELLFNELDVTELVKASAASNQQRLISLKVMLGGGMYDIPLKGYHKIGGSCGAPKLLLRLHIEFENGDTQTIVSDDSWFAETSPVRYSSIYAGEWYDATIEGKNSAAISQKPAVVTRPAWEVPLVKQQAGTFVKIKREFKTVKLNDSLYDTRQNCSGIIRIKVKGERGRNIILRPAEILKDGKIYQRCMPGYEWKYTLRGDGIETWQPQFSYTGFRYIQVVADEGVELIQLVGLHTSTDAPEVGTFECSDTLFNQIHTLIDWAIRSNLVSITTDCPTREKLGWQEQNHLMAFSMMYRYDMRALMNKIADDLANSQHDDGAIPTIAPEFTLFDKDSGFEDTPEWGASFILCPWYTYQWYGDDSAMRKHYGSMKRYIDYLINRSAEDGILDYGLGDWFDMGPERPGKAQLTSVALSATAMLHYDLKTIEKIATHLGYKGDAENYARLAHKVKDAFNKRFATNDERVYENGSQTGLAMALYMDLVTDDTRQKALDALIKDIESRGYALTAGDVGFRYVVQVLQQNGRGDILYKMNHNDAIPGYAYQLKKGATALTESWQGYDNVSNNHLMLGHIIEWLYGGLGGINIANKVLQSDPAWSHIVINPQMVGNVYWAKTSLNTPKGVVRCYWTKEPATDKELKSPLTWTVFVTIPQGSDAKIYLPDGRRVDVKEGSHSFSSLD